MIKYPDRVSGDDEKFVNGESNNQVFVVRCDAAQRVANPEPAGNVEHAETKPMAHHIAKTSARRGQSVGGMQTRNLLRQALNVK